MYQLQMNLINSIVYYIFIYIFSVRENAKKKKKTFLVFSEGEQQFAISDNKPRLPESRSKCVSFHKCPLSLEVPA